MTTTAEVLHRLDAALYRVGTDPTGLAALRRGAGRTPMDLPGTWPVLLPVVHDAPWAEEAVHHALTLYSVHQQSVPTSMHKPGVVWAPPPASCGPSATAAGSTAGSWRRPRPPAPPRWPSTCAGW